MLAYSGETLQYVCSWEDDGAHSDFADQYAYEFTDGVNTKTTLYYAPEISNGDTDDPNVDSEIYESESKEKFFEQYGLTEETEMELEFKLYIYATDITTDYETYTTTYTLVEELTRGNDLLDSGGANTSIAA